MPLSIFGQTEVTYQGQQTGFGNLALCAKGRDHIHLKVSTIFLRLAQ